MIRLNSGDSSQKKTQAERYLRILTGVTQNLSPSVVHLQYSTYAKTAITHLLHRNALTQENMEMFLLKIEDETSKPYRKENLSPENWLRFEHPLISLCSSEFLYLHKEILIEKNIFRVGHDQEIEEPTRPNKMPKGVNKENVKRKHNFILLVGDRSVCPNCASTVNEFQKIISMFEPFSQFKNLTANEDLNFSIANVMRLPMDNLVPGELPAIVYLGLEGYETFKEGKKAGVPSAVTADTGVTQKVFRSINKKLGIFFFKSNRFGRMVQTVVNQPLAKVEEVPEFLNLATIKITK